MSLKEHESINRDEIRRRVEIGSFTICAKAGEGLYARAFMIKSHAHLSKEDQKKLFGDRPVGLIDVCGFNTVLRNIPVASGNSEFSLVEITFTEATKARFKGLKIYTGNRDDCLDCTLESPHRIVELEKGIAAAARHLHISPGLAAIYGLSDQQRISATIPGEERKIEFKNIIVLVGDIETVELHLDADEALSANLEDGQIVCLEK